MTASGATNFGDDIFGAASSAAAPVGRTPLRGRGGGRIRPERIRPALEACSDAPENAPPTGELRPEGPSAEPSPPFRAARRRTTHPGRAEGTTRAGRTTSGATSFGAAASAAVPVGADPTARSWRRGSPRERVRPALEACSDSPGMAPPTRELRPEGPSAEPPPPFRAARRRTTHPGRAEGTTRAGRTTSGGDFLGAAASAAVPVGADPTARSWRRGVRESASGPLSKPAPTRRGWRRRRENCDPRGRPPSRRRRSRAARLRVKPPGRAEGRLRPG